jgi:hypothetical protein
MIRAAKASWAPRLALVVALLTAAGAVLALGLSSAGGIDTLVDGSSPDYQATQRDAQQFGSAAVVVLVHERLGDLFGSADLVTISELEACLAGEQLKRSTKLAAYVPVNAATARPYGGSGGPCAALMRMHAAKVVYGPGTFLNRAVAAVNSQLSKLVDQAVGTVKQAQMAAAKLARRQGLGPTQVRAAEQQAARLVAERQLKALSTAAQRAGIKGTPSIGDRAFVSQIVFRSGGTVKPRFAYLFPDRQHALIQVRLRAGLSDAQQARAIKLVRSAIRMPMFRLSGGGYLVTGEPVVLNDLAAGIGHQALRLLIGAVAVMAIVLLLIFRRLRRLLPLVLALATVAITFGLAALLGFTLTMASVAVLPVLIGLAVDYGVQLQAGTRRPWVAAAATATAVGFLVLLISPVPMVRAFGLMLALGTAVGFVLASVCLRPSGMGIGHAPARVAGARGAVRWPAAVAPSVRGAHEILADARRPLARLFARWRLRPQLAPLLRALTARPWTVLLLAAALAVGGWAAESQARVQSDLTKLVPSKMPALQHLRTLERVTGISGELDVFVSGRAVATSRALAWMVGYENRIARRFGYDDASGCRAATVCPALSLPDLFTDVGSGGAASPGQAQIDGLLSAVPTYFSRSVLTPNRRHATLAFGIRLMPLAKQQRVVAYMRAQLDPPAGIRAQLTGLPVLAVDAERSLSGTGRRILMLVAGLLAVALVLLALLRSPRRALLPLVPILLATGWSALIVWALGIALNPMSATLGALVIAISTEFSVLLCERVRVERRGGLEALERAYRSTGAAVLASGVTAVAGFAVLTLSDITMLRDFGLVTVIDLAASLTGVLLITPALLTVTARAERR